MAGHEYRKTRQPAVESKAHSQLCDQMVDNAFKNLGVRQMTEDSIDGDILESVNIVESLLDNPLERSTHFNLDLMLKIAQTLKPTLSKTSTREKISTPSDRERATGSGPKGRSRGEESWRGVEKPWALGGCLENKSKSTLLPSEAKKKSSLCVPALPGTCTPVSNIKDMPYVGERREEVKREGDVIIINLDDDPSDVDGLRFLDENCDVMPKLDNFMEEEDDAENDEDS
ncbi:hypothetical protein AAMO2058_001088600 [Amorphochlora amoebiformis]